MKKPLFAIVVLGMILSLSSFENSELSLFFNMDPLDKTIDLPDSPFDYSIQVPEHKQGQDEFWGFFETPESIEVDDHLATLGRALFYDEIISADLNMSCATCHKQELSFADDIALSIGTGEPTKRNSLQLNDLGWTNKDGFFWDMRALELKEIIAIPLTDNNEIGLTDIDKVAERMMETSYYPELFESAFGPQYAITEENITEALFQFIISINSFNSTIDQKTIANESLSNEEQFGRDVYSWACATCHTEGSLSEGFEFIPFIYFNGQEETDDMGMGEFHPAFEHGFKVPTLRNIALTGPYMHDGSMQTLDEVITHYSEDAVDDGWGIVPPGGFQFTEEEKTGLLAFLNTFTDESMTTNEKWADPFLRTTDTDDLVGIEFKMEIFPNPTSDIINLRFNNVNQEMIHVALYNPLGQLIRQSSIHGNTVQLNVRSEPVGVYYVHSSIGDHRIVKEVIIQ